MQKVKTVDIDPTGFPPTVIRQSKGHIIIVDDPRDPMEPLTQADLDWIRKNLGHRFKTLPQDKQIDLQPDHVVDKDTLQ